MSAGATKSVSRRDEQPRGAEAQDEQNRHNDHTGQQDQQQGRTLAEWVTFGIATALLLGVGGLVLYLWFGVPQTPPVITISQTGDTREVAGQYYVPFTVRNTGGGTADAVKVHAELRIGDQVVEESEQQFDFLSGGETEEGAFVFDQDPRSGELKMGVDSYKLP